MCVDFSVEDDSGDPWVKFVAGESLDGQTGAQMDKMLFIDVRTNKLVVVLQRQLIPEFTPFQIFTTVCSEKCIFSTDLLF